MSGLMGMIAAADEEYLVALANKGLYKRAVRELSESGAEVSLGEESLHVSFADGTEVRMDGSIQNYSCSCPSRSVCKHLLMAVLAAKEMAAGGPSAGDGNAGDEAPASAPDFPSLLELGPKALEKAAGKRNFGAAVTAIQLGERAEIEQGSTLSVTLLDSGYTVRFLPGALPETAGCSCKSTELCAHKVQAILQYIAHEKGGLPAEFFPQETQGAFEFQSYALPYVRGFLAEVMATGLARLPEDTAGRFLQLATLAHSQRLARMERLCERVAGQLALFRAKSAGFDRLRLTSDLCELIGTCDAILAGDGSRETVGVFRETYRPVASLELWGLGAFGWMSTGGYTGVTTLFYCPERQVILRHTAAMPSSATDPDKLYNGGAPWGIPGRLSAVGHAQLRLRGAKMTDQGQLSGSERTVAAISGAVAYGAPELDAIRFEDFRLLLDALWRQMESGSGDPLTAIVAPARIGPSSFDAIRQEFSLPLFDGAERRLRLRVRYEPATRLLLENLLGMEEEDRLTGPFLLRVFLREGELAAFPVAHYAPAPSNLGLDRPKKPKTLRKSFFDWGVV